MIKPQDVGHELRNFLQTFPQQDHEFLLDVDPGDRVGQVGGLALVNII